MNRLIVDLFCLGDELKFDSEYNVAFGPTKLQQLIGHLAPPTSTD